MFSKQVRFGFIFLLLIAGAWCFYQNYYVLLVFALMLILYIIWSYFKHGTVALAAKYFRNKDFEKTRYFLSQINNPDRLLIKRRGYYEFMLGNIALQDKDYDKAMHHFQIASTFPLHSENDKAYVLLHLANLSYRNQDKARAKTYLKKASEFKISIKVAALIEKLNKELN